MIPHNANDEWIRNLRTVLADGQKYSPRGKETRELLCHTSRIDMRYPIVTNQARKMGYRFLFAEAHWILSGDNRVETISPFARHIVNFSDDGYRYQGAYGPKVTEQLRYVCETLHADEHSRQAVINIWRENPRPTKDVPCTLNLQFLLRRDEMGNLKLNCVANMRSSDLWLGWVYDVFNFTMITSWVGLRLREMSHGLLDVDLGILYLTAGSQHIYAHNIDDAKQCAYHGVPWNYRPFSLFNFDGPMSLMSYLVAQRDRQWDTIGDQFFSELRQYIE